mmetsp:Transcript_10211/g.19986  ORF Transcript_10211/g.19986 Transcript_10211/m.19986 type:complete len:278 (+) Transcript_10211:263-1096(+)
MVAAPELRNNQLEHPLMSRVIAHRGARSSAPENTIEALVRAHELGATFCEIDVMLSKDKEVFINHDFTVDRCSNGVGNFGDKTAAELLALDVGSWFSKEYTGAQYPTLKAAVNKCQQLGLGLNVEIKHLRKKADDECLEGSEIAEREREVAMQTARVIREMNANTSALVFSSFSVWALEVIQREMPLVKRALLVEAIPDDWQDQVTRLGCSSINFNSKLATKEQVEKIRQCGVEMYSYTVNDPERAWELMQWGVSGVFADCPAEIESYLKINSQSRG